MSAYNTSDYYKHNLPVGKRLLEIDAGDWTGAAPTTLTTQPGAGQCKFVKYVILRIDNAFAMSAGDTIVITANAYDDVTFEQYTITDTLPITQLIRIGHPDKYRAKVIEGINYHIIVIPYEPSLYLRSSTTTAESISFVYNNVGGGITAGSAKIDVIGWECLETDSGLS
jgi:hypothetical protein